MSNARVGAPFVASGVIPSRVINVAVDTAYLYSQTSGVYAGAGIYMMDNNVAGGSTGQGGEELHSIVAPGFGIAFNVFPIDALGGQGDAVEIVGFEVSDGVNIFGNWGWPSKATAGAYQWVGTTMVQGQMTYQLKIGVSVGGAPMKYFWWDPFMTCHS